MTLQIIVLIVVKTPIMREMGGLSGLKIIGLELASLHGHLVWQK